MKEFTIIETREKSLKLQAENGVTFFVMKKWMRENGTLTPKGIEALENAKKGEAVKYEAKSYTLKASNAVFIETKYGEKLLAECYDGSKLWLNPSKCELNGDNEIEIQAGYALWLKSEKKEGWKQIKGLQ